MRASLHFLILFAALLVGRPVWAQEKVLQKTPFEYVDPTADSVSVSGEFNAWKPVAMAKDAAGVWRLELELEAGTYGYKFLRNDTDWLMDPRNEDTVDVGGVPNSRLTVLASPPVVVEREWTQAGSGRKLRATMTGYDGKRVVLSVAGGKDYELALDALSAEDRQYVENWKAGQGTDALPSAKPPLDASQWSRKLIAGGEPVRWTFEVPELPKKTSGGGFPEDRKGPIQIEVRVSIPAGFDPAAGGNWIGLVSATATGNTKSCDAMDMYWRHCTANGMACMAADIVAEGDELRVWAGTDVRWSLFIMAMEEMSKDWPGMKGWTWVPMGFSGGGGYTMYFGALMDKLNWDCGGLLSNASGYTDMHFSDDLRAKSSYYRDIPFYMSFGKNDDVLSANARDGNIAWGEKSLRHFRYAVFDGGHECHPPHVDEALKWFKETRVDEKKGGGSGLDR